MSLFVHYQGCFKQRIYFDDKKLNTRNDKKVGVRCYHKITACFLKLLGIKIETVKLDGKIYYVNKASFRKLAHFWRVKYQFETHSTQTVNIVKEFLFFYKSKTKTPAKKNVLESEKKMQKRKSRPRCKKRLRPISNPGLARSLLSAFNDVDKEDLPASTPKHEN